ncbi:hypothetical protein LNP04_15160 [Chryseobacterium sp. C-71]|uniref:hypothetical protein n=1 Tax=Chryseobacterium sp. C-71 TaxID=2893882 RepID=UPI001E2C858A|nr:hypothetical protein [Chryseobacterium sp. C-71]UFH31295.1 hypothetical protein LNP04_15160 [Chryseobacterium sp. C-71]
MIVLTDNQKNAVTPSPDRNGILFCCKDKAQTQKRYSEELDEASGNQWLNKSQ